VYVVMLVHNTIGRGTFDRAHSLGRHLANRGHHVTLFAGASARSAARKHWLNGVEVIEPFDPSSGRLRESGLSPFDTFSRIGRLGSIKCDLVHCFDHRPAVSIPGLWFSRQRRIPCLFDWADLWGQGGIAGERRKLSRCTLGMVDGFLEERVRRRADGLTVINTALKQRASQKFKAPIHLLPVGASSDLIIPLSKNEMRNRLGLPLDVPIAIHTGLAPYDMAYMAQEFVQLLKWHPNALLVTTGRPFPVVERIMGEAGVGGQLAWIGMLNRERLTEAMACADVLLLPYRNRSVNLFRYPNKLGDYLSAGRPVVTNRTGDLGQLVCDERVGLAADDTPGAFALAVKKLFDEPKLAEDTGRRGRALAENKLDWQFLAAGLERFYTDILASRR
jgi:glycosyltransferase involved in cell wall biosynthesis